MNKLYKGCPHCKGTGKVKLKQTRLDTPDVNKMQKILDKYNWTQGDLAKACGVAQGTVNGWFYHKTNLQGKIKKIYFTILKSKGFI